jgi:hypothetical protein
MRLDKFVVAKEIRVTIDPSMTSHPARHGRIDVDCDLMVLKNKDDMTV